eukprot:Skav206215  [mRNA]  locus=scaffold1844:512197:519913:- [translate_table: standard]
MEDGSQKVEVRSLGADNGALTSMLSAQFNRRAGVIHICSGWEDCPYTDEIQFHVDHLNLVDPDNHGIRYITSGGKKLLKGLKERGLVKPTAKPSAAPSKRTRKSGEDGSTDRSRSGRRDTLEGPAAVVEVPTGGQAGPPDGSKEDKHLALRERLKAVRERKQSTAPTTPDSEVDPVWVRGATLDLGSRSAPTSRVSALKSGRQLPTSGQDLDSMIQGHGSSGTKSKDNTAEQRGDTMRSSRTSASSRGVSSQLALTAMAAQEDRNRGGGDPPRRGRSDRRRRSRSRRRRRSRRKRSRKRSKRGAGAPGGDPGGSSSGSEDGDDDASSGEESSYSETENEYLPPLKRKSERRAGSVFELLLQQAPGQSERYPRRPEEETWLGKRKRSKSAQFEYLKSIEDNVRRVLLEDKEVEWKLQDIEADIKSRMVSYTGEEISAPEVLSVSQVVPGLPPEDHGGSVALEDWLGGKCKWYIENPRACIEEDIGQTLPPLKAKVHIAAGEKMALAKLLVERRICRWTPENRVVQYRGVRVLNGMFGVRKKGLASCGRPILRLIMNMIPSNSIHRVISGRVGRLPNICAWSNIVCSEGQLISVCQSDMAAAFYLFRLPLAWSEQLCFDISGTASELGLEDRPLDEVQYLSCAVLPMGWSSAVGVMQFIAEEVLFRNGLPNSHQIRGGSPLPPWVVSSATTAQKSNRVWWHVYLDNYASGEVHDADQEASGGTWQHSVEEWWEDAGISCSKEKSVVNSKEATELGAFISGRHHWMGAGIERLVKVIKTTLWLVEKGAMRKKEVQVVMGRWIFITQFRRPAMAQFQEVWKLVGNEGWRSSVEEKARQEMMGAVLGTVLYHVSFTNQIEDMITCSDASATGGAIAFSRELSPQGKVFLMQQEAANRPVKVPVYVVSLFNGIGAAFRCYDLCGCLPVGGLSVDIHKPGNRVSSRRWPWVEQWDDICTLTEQKLEEIIDKDDEFTHIHVWAGFPCVDLSKVKAGRRNLAGRQSSLIHEGVRVIGTLRRLFPNVEVQHIIENVSSMDVSARDEISELLGSRPYKLDPQHQVPLSRPRFAWVSFPLWDTEDVRLIDKGGYIEVMISTGWPDSITWLKPGSVETSEGVVYPCCMKSIRRSQPPEKPAGLERCDRQTVERWESEDYKFPPYQFKSQYLIWDTELGSHRLLDVEERELLMGLGLGHTKHCLSGSAIKQSQQRYEDERLSLVGDSFSCWSFAIVAAFALALKRARRKRRQGLSLEDRGITASTRSRYYTAVRRVLPILENSTADEDESLAMWIEDQYSEGEGITYVGDALSGLHHYCPQLRGRLSKSWRLFKLWRRIEKPAQAPPLPQSFAEAMISREIELGDLDMAVAIALGFFGMLRTGELLVMSPYHVLIGEEDAVIQLGQRGDVEERELRMNLKRKFQRIRKQLKYRKDLPYGLAFSDGAAHAEFQMQPEHFEMWLGCFNRSMVAHILPPDVADKLHHCFQSLTSAMQTSSLPRLTSEEDDRDKVEDKMDWGRLQGLIDELGGESGLSTLIECFGGRFAIGIGAPKV